MNAILFLMLNRMRGARKDIILRMGMLLAVCGIAYVASQSLLHLANVPASVLCFMVPSFIVLLLYSENRGFLFVFNFCLADILNLLVCILSTVIARRIGVPYMNLLAYLLLMTSLLCLVRRIRSKYMAIQASYRKGWSILAVYLLFSYINLCVVLGYPTDISTRPAYLPSLILAVILILLFIGVLVAVFSMRDEKGKYEQMALIDALTGLGNRAAFMKETDRMISDLEEYIPVFCISIDINDLKKVNDQFGHEAGDEHIRAAAQLLQQVFPERARLYRIGGDEFFILMKGRKDDDITVFEDAFDRAMAEYSSTHPRELSMAFGASKIIHMPATQSECEKLCQEAIQSADSRMYEKKRRMKALRA